MALTVDTKVGPAHATTVLCDWVLTRLSPSEVVISGEGWDDNPLDEVSAVPVLAIRASADGHYVVVCADSAYRVYNCDRGMRGFSSQPALRYGQPIKCIGEDEAL